VGRWRVLADVLFFSGAGAVVYGCWLVAPWLAWVVGGAELMAAALIVHGAKAGR